MEKIPVNIIVPKNKRNLSSRCNLWYIPCCPCEIKDPIGWYENIVRFINMHRDDYNILHVPNCIYDYQDEELSYKTYAEHEIENIFIVGVGKDKHLFHLSNIVPEGYHVAYCLDRNISLFKKYDDRDVYVQEILYDYAAKTMIYISIFIFVMIFFFS